MAAVILFLGKEDVADLHAPVKAQPKQREFPGWKVEEPRCSCESAIGLEIMEYRMVWIGRTFKAHH